MPSLLSLNSYHYRRGGSDAVYFDHEAMFAAMGWQTAHMAMKHPKNLASPWSDYFVEELEFGHSYSMLDKLRMAGKVVYSLEARQQLARLLDRFRPDVAHVHCIYHHLSPSVLPLLRERGIPVVLTAHDLKIACPAYKMLNRGGVCEKCRGGNLLHLVANRCVRDSLAVSALVAVESTVSKGLGLYRRNVDKVVTPSRFYHAKLQEWGWPAEQLVYIPNYVQAELFEPNPLPGRYFLYFGRLAPEKGVATLIKAAKTARVPLKIVGTGPEQEALQALASDSPDIEFLGFKSGPELWDLVRGCRAVVLPSEWYENAPMSILEAQALGKPVIGADIGGIPEMISNGETGYVFESGSDQSLTAILTTASNASEHTLKDIGLRGRQSVIDNFSARNYQEQMSTLYSDVANRSQPKI